MIAVIFAARSDPGGTVAYLFGPGRDKPGQVDEQQHVHCDQHTVAGIEFPDLPTAEQVELISANLRFNAQNHGFAADTKHIHHITLALSPDETKTLSTPGQVGLTDDKWQAIADDYLTSMKWKTDAGLSYTVVRHGVNANGGDHVHILMSDVTDAGGRVNMGRSKMRTQAVMPAIEQRHGLKAVAGRGGPLAPRPLSRGEQEQLRDRPGTVPDRLRAEPRVRAAAIAARTEAQFPDLLRADGFTPLARVKADGEVVGYSIKEGGGRPIAGSKLARDLSLVQLRKQWDRDTPEDRVAARAAWAGTAPPAAPPADAPAPSLDAVKGDLRAVGDRLRTTTSTAEFTAISHDLAGACAVASKATKGLESEQWAQRSRDVGRSAQTRWSPGPVAGTGLALAAGILAAGNPSAAVVLLAIIDALYRMHDSRKDQARTDDIKRPDRIRPPTAAERRVLDAHWDVLRATAKRADPKDDALIRNHRDVLIDAQRRPDRIPKDGILIGAHLDALAAATAREEKPAAQDDPYHVPMDPYDGCLPEDNAPGRPDAARPTEPPTDRLDCMSAEDWAAEPLAEPTTGKVDDAWKVFDAEWESVPLSHPAPRAESDRIRSGQPKNGSREWSADQVRGMTKAAAADALADRHRPPVNQGIPKVITPARRR